MTALTHDALWHEERRSGIGASDAPAIMGVGFESAYELWCEKSGLVSPTDLSNNTRVEWGTRLEDAIAQKIIDQHPDWKVRRANVMRRSRKFPFAFAHFDRLARLPDERRAIPVEIKTSGFDDGWGEHGTDGVHARYYPQIQHQIAIANSPYAIVAVLIAGNDYREYIVPRNDIFIEHLMNAEDAFWMGVLTGKPPEPSTTSDLVHRFPQLQGALVADDTLKQLCAELRAARKQRDVYDAKASELSVALQNAMAEHIHLTDDKGKKLAWITTTNRLDFKDKKALIERFPDLAPYSSTSTSRAVYLAPEKGA